MRPAAGARAQAGTRAGTRAETRASRAGGRPALLAILLAALLSTLLSLAALVPAPLAAGDLAALARLDGPGEIRDRDDRLTLALPLDRPVPWRVFTLTDPPRLVLDFSEVDWAGLDTAALAAASPRLERIEAGLFRPGWSRLVAVLNTPLRVESAAMTSRAHGAALVEITLVPTDAADFAARAGAPPGALFADAATPAPATTAHRRQGGNRPLVVVLDPGHGGIDPGAERDGVREADLVLQFARTLKETLVRSGFDVVLTREDDSFVPLETRVTIARRAGADAFISLHADVLAQGRANGATVYTLSDAASDLASQLLAERHDRADLLAGVDLSRQGDEVALVMMEMARRETRPRSEALADAIAEGIFAATGSSYKNPRLQAAFSVLKAPDIPSVLIELGFLSSPRDRANLTSPAWRQAAAEGIRDALQYWAIEDAAQAVRLRQ